MGKAESSNDGPVVRKSLAKHLRAISVMWEPIKPKRDEQAYLVRRALRSTPLFEGLSPHDWKLISSLFHIRKYDHGEVVFECGTPGLGMYVVIDGYVRIVVDEEGEELELSIMQEGDFFGEMSLIDEVVRSATAIAEGETRLVGLFRPQLRELMHHRPKLGIILYERLAQIVVRRLRESNRLLAEHDEMDDKEAD